MLRGLHRGPAAEKFAVIFREIEKLNAGEFLRAIRPDGADIDGDGFGDAVQVERHAVHGIHIKFSGSSQKKAVLAQVQKAAWSVRA